jgi:hypothetical protein
LTLPLPLPRLPPPPPQPQQPGLLAGRRASLALVLVLPVLVVLVVALLRALLQVGARPPQSSAGAQNAVVPSGRLHARWCRPRRRHHHHHHHRRRLPHDRCHR